MTSYKTKTYDKNTLSDIRQIAAELNDLFLASKKPLRTVAQIAMLSTNSAKAVLAGKPANIATYDSVARALGSSIIEICTNLNNKTIAAESPGGALDDEGFRESTEESGQESQEEMDSADQQEDSIYSE